MWLADRSVEPSVKELLFQVTKDVRLRKAIMKLDFGDSHA
jgi:hypothetical protein